MSQCRLSRNRFSRTRRKSGFVLVLVVILLAIACLVMTQVAMRSLGKVRRTIDMEDQLRQRWSIISLRRSALGQAANLLDQVQPAPDAIEAGAAPVRSLESRVRFNEEQWLVRIEDESSKLPLLAAARDFPKQSFEQRVKRVFGVGSMVDYFDVAAQGRTAGWRPWQPEHGLSHDLLNRTDEVTLWGNGRMNVLRAKEATIADAWRGLFGVLPPKELAEAYRQWPTPSWAEIAKDLDLNKTQLGQVNRWFSTSSRCFSAEINALDSDSGKSYLFVSEGSTQNFGYEY